MQRDLSLDIVERLVREALDAAGDLDARRLGGAQVAVLDQVTAGLHDVRRLAGASPPGAETVQDDVLTEMRTLVRDAVVACDRITP